MYLWQMLWFQVKAASRRLMQAFIPVALATVLSLVQACTDSSNLFLNQALVAFYQNIP